MDLDTINHRKFTGTCNSCGKKGHKEADCRNKITCRFCGKKGHKESDCYTKKNKGNDNWKPQDKKTVQIDTIQENTSDHKSLSWTACYDDSCLTHRSDKEGSGYYPRRRSRAKTVEIDTLDLCDEGNSDWDSECEYCGISDPTHECTERPNTPPTWCDIYQSRDPNHECQGCPDCGSIPTHLRR
ncbi:hypothetical protein ACQKWADRAFT_67649 [Trichoderma austrokoningii]